MHKQPLLGSKSNTSCASVSPVSAYTFNLISGTWCCSSPQARYSWAHPMTLMTPVWVWPHMVTPRCHGLTKALGQPVALCVCVAGDAALPLPHCPSLDSTALAAPCQEGHQLPPPSSLPPVHEKHLSGSSSISRPGDQGSHTNAHWGHLWGSTVFWVCP